MRKAIGDVNSGDDSKQSSSGYGEDISISQVCGSCGQTGCVSGKEAAVLAFDPKVRKYNQVHTSILYA